jgi:type IV secretion system protein VirB6
MSDACSAAPGTLGLIGSVNRFIDCQADLLGSGAYGALASPGSTLTLVLTGLLTILVAMIGYNLLVGRGLDLRTGTLTMVKLGAVLALATSWPAYRTLVYDVVTQAPGQMVAEIGRSASLPGADGTLVERLDLADAAMQRLAILGPGDPPGWQAESIPPPPMAGFNAFALGGARILFLLASLAGLVGVRIIAALMLALGPFFIAFLLFDNTRSLFEGWVRVIAGAAIGAIGISVALALELAVLEPWLAGVLTRRIAGEALPTIPTELFVITAMFTLVLLAVAGASVRLATAFRLAAWGATARRSEVIAPAGAVSAVGAVSPAEREDVRSRAAAMASAITSLHRRDVAGRELGGASRVVVPPHAREAAQQTSIGNGPGLPIGRSFPRSCGSTPSARTRMAAASRRDPG